MLITLSRSLLPLLFSSSSSNCANINNQLLLRYLVTSVSSGTRILPRSNTHKHNPNQSGALINKCSVNHFSSSKNYLHPEDRDSLSLESTMEPTPMKPHAHRKFYHLPELPPSTELAGGGTLDENHVTTGPPPFAGTAGMRNKKPKSKITLQRRNTRGLIEMIEQNLFGRETVFQGPFGPRRNVYVDQTASGQSLRCIEDYIHEHVLPHYGNTHTTSTNTSSQTTMFRHEARDIVRNSVGASEHDAVIFCGSGATGPVHKLVQNIAGDRSMPPPIVFVGPFEHHSNLLPWRDIGSTMVYIPQTSDGGFDISFLEERLKEIKSEPNNKKRMLIGSFSVASNVTGMVTDDVAVTILMHKYGGLAFWDYSAAASHVQIIMNPVVFGRGEEGLAKKDALFFSGHKLAGGPQTPGVLVAKKSLFENHIPNGGGGGTVFFVTSDGHRYLKNPEYREEGGTPAIIESIRLGLVFRLKDSIGSRNIINREELFAKKIIDDWSKCEEIKILGTNSLPRVPIISFLIEHPESGFYLHYNFVVGLLNDLFGLQTRGGCACAGPYSQSLLGIDVNLAHTYENLLLEDSRLDRNHLRRQEECSSYEIFRPGFVRLSVPYYSSMQEAEFISEAVKLVAKHGWKLLPLYMCNPETGEFHHHLNNMFHHRKWLSWATFDSEGIKSKERTRNNSEDYPNYEECLQQAKNIFSNAENLCKRRNLPNQSLLFGAEFSHLRWFLLPSESLSILNGTWNQPSIQKPYTVKKFPKPASNIEYYESSVPRQIIQATTNVGEELKVKRGKLGDSESHGSSDLSINGSDHEHHEQYFTPGETVTGPSIWFPRTSIDSVNSTPEPPFQESQIVESSTPVDVLNNNHSQAQVLEEVDSGRMTGNSQLEFSVQQVQCSEYGFPQPLNNNMYQKVESFIPTESDSLQQHVLNQNQASPPQTYLKQNYLPSPGSIMTDNGVSNVSSPVSFSYQNLNCNQEYYTPINGDLNLSPYEIPGSCISDTNIYQPSIQTKMENLNISNYNQSGVMMPTYASPPLQVYNCCSPNNSYSPVVFNNMQQSPPNQLNGNDCRLNYNDNSVLQSNNYYLPQYNSPGANYVQQTQYPQVYPQSPQQSNCNINSECPINASDKSSQELLLISQSSEDFHDVVNKTLRHATSIAKELKSEIRGVISQVEQGIDPDGLRERSCSFNAKDKRFDKFRRTRTLSGHLLNYSLKRSESDRSECSHSASTDSSGTSTTGGSTTTTEKPLDTPVAEGQSKKATTKKELKEGQSPKWHCPPKNIFKPTLQAVREFSMIDNGDKVLVCLSGGKDSLSLLHTMKQLQYVLGKEGINFSFGAVTVDPGSSAYNPKPLIPYLKALDVPYFFEEQGIMPTALEKGPECVTSICSFCSRLKRGRIYSTARSNGYNSLAFGQHLDDLAESFFMSVFHNGLLRSMKAKYTVKEGDLRVIRPFVNVREKSLRDFAESSGLPIISENCPACFDAPTERYRVKQLLAQQEIIYPKIFVSLRAAIHPLIAIDKTGMESNNPERLKRSPAKKPEVLKDSLSTE